MASLKPDLNDQSDITINTLFDGGSQATFLCEDTAAKLGLETIRSDINLSIKGFNGEKLYKSRLVTLPLILNEKMYNINCLCVPEINVQFLTPGMREFVELVTKSGHKLAYKPYYRKDLTHVTNIECIIGSQDCEIFSSLEAVHFGHENKKSVYHKIDDEIIPIGSIQLFIDNLKYLKSDSNSVSLNVATLELDSQSIPFLEIIKADKKLSDNYIDNYELTSPTLGENGSLVEVLDIASYVELDKKCKSMFDMDEGDDEDDKFVSESEVTRFILDNSRIDEEGRHEMAIPWLTRFKHKLGSNEKLAYRVLQSVLNKFTSKPEVLAATDEVFKIQVASGIIEEVPDITQFKKENPGFSFISHFPLLKPDRATTKVRVIYLCNLAERNPDKSPGININNIAHPGFTKNSKISSSFQFVRFEPYLLSFDIKRAFHCMSISESNQKKFLFKWFKDVKNGDFTLINYKFKRVPFGLAPAPFLLSVALHRFLMNEETNMESLPCAEKNLIDLKKLIFHGSYVDNLFVPCDSLDYLNYVHDESVKLFERNKFPLQQWTTNHISFQAHLDTIYGENTDQYSKILGMIWDIKHDELNAPKYNMKAEISTKRQVLKELQSNFDLTGSKIPLLNRAKLFMHGLQCDENLSWDADIGNVKVKEWKNIVSQFNDHEPIKISRNMGGLKDSYELCTMVDASKQFIGSVIYLKNLSTGQISFLKAQNKLLNKMNRTKSIPTLEFSGLEYGVMKVLDVFQEFKKAVVPITINAIRLFSDSTIALSWLNDSEYLNKKLQTRTTYVNNRISNVVKMCSNICPIYFAHMGTNVNPADMVTRCFSPKRLKSSNYISGPNVLKTNMDLLDWTVVPNPIANNDPNLPKFSVNQILVKEPSLPVLFIDLSKVYDLDRSSSLDKSIRILSLVQKFRNKLKLLLYKKDSIKYAHFHNIDSNLEIYSECEKLLLVADQEKHFSDIVTFFRLKPKERNKIPPLVSQMNIVLDPDDGLLKVKSKMGRLYRSKVTKFPLLIHPKSYFLKLLTWKTHYKFNHSGVYFILNQLRRKYFILKPFSSVKKILNECILCRRFNARSIKLNTNDYKPYMVNPKQRLYSTVWLDYAGPFCVKAYRKDNLKVYILVFKCAWSKHINLEVTSSMDTQSFLRAFQNHIYKFGLPSVIQSDAGSNLSAGFNWLKDELETVEVKEYFSEMKIDFPEFIQLPKGSLNRGIPGFIESGVKQIKRLIHGSIKNNVVELIEFIHIVNQCECYANKRPLNEFSALRDQNVNSCYRIVTPEILRLGYETAVLELNLPKHDLDNWSPDIDNVESVSKNKVEQLIKIKSKVREHYFDEFLYSLLDQATCRKGKYLPVAHQKLYPGDTCWIKDPFLKRSHMPLGLILKTFQNSIGEVTKAELRKANKHVVTRDVSDLILVVRNEEPDRDINLVNDVDLSNISDIEFDSKLSDSNRSGLESENSIIIKQPRAAALVSRQRTRHHLKM